MKKKLNIITQSLFEYCNKIILTLILIYDLTPPLSNAAPT